MNVYFLRIFYKETKNSEYRRRKQRAYLLQDQDTKNKFLLFTFSQINKKIQINKKYTNNNNKFPLKRSF